MKVENRGRTGWPSSAWKMAIKTEEEEKMNSTWTEPDPLGWTELDVNPNGSLSTEPEDRKLGSIPISVYWATSLFNAVLVML